MYFDVASEPPLLGVTAWKAFHAAANAVMVPAVHAPSFCWLSAIGDIESRLLQFRPTPLLSRRTEDVAKRGDRKSTRLNSSHTVMSYAVFCLKKKELSMRHTASIPAPPPYTSVKLATFTAYT